MTIKLLNAFPNAFLPREGQTLVIKGISEAEASEILKKGFQSYVGHESFAPVLAARLGVDVPVCREPATFDGTIVVGAVQPPRRLKEGEIWTEEEILAMPIIYVLIEA